MHSKNLSAKCRKVAGRLVLSHSVSWRFENFIVVEAMEIGLRELFQDKVHCVCTKIFLRMQFIENSYKIVKVSVLVLVRMACRIGILSQRISC